MKLNIDAWSQSVGYEIWFDWDCITSPEPIVELVTTIKEAYQSVKPIDSFVANRLEQTKPRILKPTKRNWEKILTELRQGRLYNLGYNTTSMDGRTLFIVSLSLNGEKWREINPSSVINYDSLWLVVNLQLLLDGIVDLKTLQDIMVWTWETLSGVYGFADKFISHSLGAVSPKQERAAEQALIAKRWQVNTLRGDPKLYVPDAFWLNYLNASHIQTLGGLNQVRQRLPTAEIIALPNGGASIRISPSPLYESRDEWESDHANLKEVLLPILQK
ncbi:MAG: DUF3396 domain-containing protein [Gammaproteobacteria bacterium]|nr:DUF3396 domain-containing protein [Gammaproteobacteria bacterium]